MRNEINQGRKVRSRNEINNICPKQGRGSGLKASAADLYPNFPWLQLITEVAVRQGFTVQLER